MPYVSFLVVPRVLLALLLMPVSTLLSGYLFSAANALLDLIWPVIEALSMHPWAYWVQAAPQWPVVLLALVGVALLLAPRGIPARWLGAIMLLPVVLNSAEKPAVGNFEATLLDVGQGLSMVVRTQNHSLVFDAGNRFGSRLDAGKSVVIPYLRNSSIKQLNRLVVSHGDADHIGGAQAIIDAYPEVEVIGQDIEEISAKNKRACLRGERWRWDGVDFEFLHPEDQSDSQRNNPAWVLKETASGGQLLITSDIEAEVERELTNIYGSRLRADVLVVPHHGSKTSSTQLFIDAVKPQIALLPVGYRNRYKHPKAEVVTRYRAAGSSVYHSDHEGAMKVIFDAEEGVIVEDGHRKSNRKYWNHLIAE